MTERRTIYAVETGSYSDYSVDALFVRREDAEEHAAEVNRLDSFQEAEVREYAIYPAGAQPEPTVTWSVRVYADGRTEAWSDVDWDYDGPPAAPPKRAEVRVTSYGEVHATGADKRGTIQAAKDRWGRLKAEREGIA